MEDPLIASLSAAVAAQPHDIALRLHLASLLVDRGRREEAIGHVAAALAQDPASTTARELMQRAMASDVTPPPEESSGPASQAPTSGSTEDSGAAGGQFDWAAAESDLGDTVPPMFVDERAQASDGTAASAFDIESSGISLADVGGLVEVKKRLEASFLAPMRNPELRRLYGKSLRGGLLLYGPPGCGKTFLAKAVAGELGASFLHVSVADVLDAYVGSSEQNVHELFEAARASAPCVLFLDELDAIGQKRSMTRNSSMRNTVNQLLTELDGVGSDNEGVYVLAATNHPWDVDPALRRPGRLDRTLLVLPPDRPAREAILRTHLRDRPVERIDVGKIAKSSEGLSGADVAHLCEAAAEHALMESVETGTTRMITMAHFDLALREVRPSMGPWLETARNVAYYANGSGEYDELAAWLRKQR